MNIKSINIRYKKMLIVIIPLIILFFVFGFLTYYSASDLMGTNKATSDKSHHIEEYDYHLRSNATEYQESLFKELKNLIDNGADDLEIAECVVKNYVADAYTWDNKLGQWDVGGMCYVYSPMKNNIYSRLKDDFYGLLDKYQKENGGNGGLLEVSSIDVVSSRESDSLYEVDDCQYKAFNIRCSWEYVDGSKYSNVIDNSMFFKVIKNNDNRFEIVENYE